MSPGLSEDDLTTGRAGHSRGEKDTVAGLVVGENHSTHTAEDHGDPGHAGHAVGAAAHGAQVEYLVGAGPGQAH